MFSVCRRSAGLAIRFAIRRKRASTENTSRAETRMASTYFTGTRHAQLYQKFRPCCPQWILDDIMNFMGASSGRRLAVDVGCGSGQATASLGRYFERVVGVDVSESQITAATDNSRRSNVSYRVGNEREIPFKDAEVDLVTVFNALHYFDLPQFFNEVGRVLKPGGCLAVYRYTSYPPVVTDHLLSAKLNEAIESCHTAITDYQSAEWWRTRRVAADHYKDVELPFEDSERQIKELPHQMSVLHFKGYMQTYSAYREYLKKKDHDYDVLDILHETFLKELGITDSEAERTVLNVSFPTVLLLGRKSSI